MTDISIDKELLIDLALDPFSDNTIRFRRNLILASFTIICIHYLGASLNDLQIFGLTLGSADNVKIQILAVAMLSYWLFMYSYSHRIDMGIYRERRRQLSELTKNRKTQFEYYDDILEKHPERKNENNMYYTEWNQLKNEQETLEVIASSMKNAEATRRLLSSIETIMPIIMSLTAISVTILHATNIYHFS